MRVMLRVEFPVAEGNAAIRSGKLPQIIQGFMAKWKPEAAYFTAMEGARTAFFVFDLADTSQIPSVAEGFFMGLNAKLQLYPVMNAEDLGKGLAMLDKG